MTKKYIAIILCILAVCAVFGLEARTEYEDIKTALESVTESSKTLVDDLQALHVLAYVIENFDVEATTNIEAGILPETETSPERYILSYISLWLDESGMVESKGETFEFETKEKMGKVDAILKPLTWAKEIPQGDGTWGDVLQAVKTVVFILGAIISVVIFVVWFTLDAVLTAWEVVVMALYILGFSVTVT